MLPATNMISPREFFLDRWESIHLTLNISDSKSFDFFTEFHRHHFISGGGKCFFSSSMALIVDPFACSLINGLSASGISCLDRTSVLRDSSSVGDLICRG